VCVDNDGYEASLERNKIYPVLPDKAAEKDGDFRIVDEERRGLPVLRRSIRRHRCSRSGQSVTREGVLMHK